MVWIICINISLNEREGFKFRIVVVYKVDQVDLFIFLKLLKMNIKDILIGKLRKYFYYDFVFI